MKWLKMQLLMIVYAGITVLFAWLVTKLPGATYSFRDALLGMVLLNASLLEARRTVGKTDV